MKNAIKIFLNDLFTIRRNKAALLLMILYCILPSLYAWINIKACWNPYANTGNLPVAIINKDEGAVFNGKNINAGDGIVSALKTNKSIGWVFVDDWQGNYGLNEGKYYAVIEIPDNFTKGLVSLTTATPKKPNITYKVNEKLNAIAAKITNVAKDKLAQNVKDTFVKTVNQEAFKQLNGIGGQLQIDKSQILQLKDTMNEAYNNIEAVKKYLDEANASSEGLQSYLNKSKNTLPKLTEQINSLQKATEASKTLTLETKETIDDTSRDLNNDVIQMQSINTQIQQLLSKLKEINNYSSTDNSNTIADNLINFDEALIKIIDADIKNLENISSISSSSTSNQINMLNALKEAVTNEETKLKEIKTLFSQNSAKESINSAIDAAASLSDEVTAKIVSYSNSLYTNVLPVVNNVADNMAANLDSTESLLEVTKAVVPQLNALANLGTSTSKVSIEQANKLKEKLTYIQQQLTVVIDKMKDINENNVDQILKIITMDPEKVADFLSSPIDTQDVEVFDGGVFGVGLTPFYTVLAIWVGSLLLCSILSVECKKDYGLGSLTLKQEHFGKMLLFIMLSFIQSLIITFGDRFILGVKPESMQLMIYFTVLASIVFTIILFTLVSLFGNVGKAIAVVMMVFQIAGSGGIYPIQTNPKIFGILQPLWPFTYAINGFREAIAGPTLSSVIENSICLCIFGIVFLALVVLKKPFHKFTSYIQHKFKQAEI